jgi:hypothetical protein
MLVSFGWLRFQTGYLSIRIEAIDWETKWVISALALLTRPDTLISLAAHG